MGTDQTRTATCYLLVGGADGRLEVGLDLNEDRVAGLTITAPSGFGGMIWPIVAQMLVDAPLEIEALNERVARMTRAGLLPEELNLDPLVKTIVNLGHS